MKKILLLSASCLMLLSACKKGSQKKADEQAAQKYPFTFSTEQFSQTTSPISASSKQTLAAIPIGQSSTYAVLHYIIFDSNGSEVSRMEQSHLDTKLYRITGGTRKLINANNTFGSITDSLKAGTYTAVIVAGADVSSLNTAKVASANGYVDSYTSLSLQEAKFFPGPTNIGDAAYYKGQFQVMPNITGKTVTLSRIVGQLAINLEDAIPQGVAGISVQFQDNAYYRINTNTPESAKAVSFTYVMNSTDIGKANYILRSTVLNTLTPITVKISAVDNTFKVLYTKTIPNVQININQATTLSGKLFDANIGTGFTLTVDPTWGTGTTIKF